MRRGGPRHCNRRAGRAERHSVGVGQNLLTSGVPNEHRLTLGYADVNISRQAGADDGTGDRGELLEAHRELAGTIACHRNKMKTCHDPKIRSDRELRSRCGYNIHRRLIKASRRYA